MTFEDYVQENNLNCYLDEDAMYAVERVWNHQQDKIDSALKILNEVYPYEFDMDTGVKINKIKEILK